MRILAIETSCDETSIAVLESDKNGNFDLLSNIVSSQVKIHAPFGGVVPMLAKREHQRNLLPVLKQAFKESGLLSSVSHSEPPKGGEESPAYAGQKNPDKLGDSSARLRSPQNDKTLKVILSHEPELLKKLVPFLKKYKKPDIDIIAVTNGPGLEPALWVGVNFAKALGYFWGLPIIPINHVEGHIAANWLTLSHLSFPRKRESRSWIPGQARDDKKDGIKFPAICLVVSGGHTQLVLMEKFGDYKILGETRDDAAGEAFDKLARMLNLGYPGGPAVAKIASQRNFQFPISNFQKKPNILISKYPNIQTVKLPRPMINSNDYDFSFSGLKTAALYFVKTLDKKTLKKLTPAICAEFQQAVVDVLVSKTIRAAKEFHAKTVLLSGGVASNDLLRETLKSETEKLKTDKLTPNFSVPSKNFCTDNAAMIALTALLKTRNLKIKSYNWQKIQVNSNLRL